jgi:hypothetical protein
MTFVLLVTAIESESRDVAQVASLLRAADESIDVNARFAYRARSVLEMLVNEVGVDVNARDHGDERTCTFVAAGHLGALSCLVEELGRRL